MMLGKSSARRTANTANGIVLRCKTRNGCTNPVQGECSVEAGSHWPLLAGNVHDVVVALFQSELMAIAGNAWQWSDQETGGFLHGAWAPGNIVTVMIATPPGPEAQHHPGSFQQDMDYAGTCDHHMVSHFGVGIVGRWHSHHFLKMEELSAKDDTGAASLVVDNNLPLLVDVLVTRPTQDPRRVRIQAFVRVAGRESTAIPCPFRILPDVSPIRMALAGSAVFPSPRQFSESFPLDLIDIDKEDGGDLSDVAPEIAKAVLLLPTDLLKDTKVFCDGGLTVVDVPLLARSRGYIGFCSQSGKAISVAVKHHEDEGVRDITDEILPMTADTCSVSEIRTNLTTHMVMNVWHRCGGGAAL